MSSTQIDHSTKVSQILKKDNDKSRKMSNSSHKKYKHEENRHFKFGRKRLQSFTNNGKFFLPYKRRKKEIIPPTKFLLGGNICDPLNLNSMQDEEVNKIMNAPTPKSSPLLTPNHKKEVIEVIIPPNICDPLNLNNCNDNDNDEYEKQLISPTKKGSKRRNRKKKRASSGSGNNGSDSVESKIRDRVTTDIAEPMELSASENVVVENQHQHQQQQQQQQQQEKQEQQTAFVGNLSSANSSGQCKESKSESSQKEKNKLRLKGLEEVKDKRLRKVEIKDKIVSPVIPQPGAWKPRPQHRPSQEKKKKQNMPKFRAKDARYQYGNYNRYYGYRNSHHEMDTRLTVFAQRKHLFVGKDVLDIGCNIGHITLSVARDFSARSVTGIDIDRTLINIARKNIKHYVNCAQSPAGNEDNDHQDVNFFPMSMPINYGPVDIPGFTKDKSHKGFPYNVTFVQGNYVLENDSLLCTEQPQFDAILCLSITKWIHLNFGDAGLKHSFKRMYAQLRPGGVLLLEPQGWSSYSKKKNLTERIYKNYLGIEFRPHSFTQYLLSSEVGFSKCEVLSIPPHPSRGFQRPIHLFTKSDLSCGNAKEGEEEKVETFMTRRLERQDEKRRKIEQIEYEQKLFKKEETREGNMSEISHQSNESMSQYDQFENVYAPSATPCYDTPSHNSDSQPLDTAKRCYVDVNMDNEKMETESQESKVVTSKNTFDNLHQTFERSTVNQLSQKRAIDVDQVQSNAKRMKQFDDTDKYTDERKRVTEVMQVMEEETLQEPAYMNESKSKKGRKKEYLEDESRRSSEKEQSERQRCEPIPDNT